MDVAGDPRSVALVMSTGWLLLVPGCIVDAFPVMILIGSLAGSLLLAPILDTTMIGQD